jgi:predicted metallo-beta-lactamase superfamily hydrolase
MRNLGKLVEGGVEELIIDHHFLRDMKYSQYMKNLEEAYPGAKICTAAEYMGKEVELLEARRRELYRQGCSEGD